MRKWIIGAALLIFTSYQVDAQQRNREQPNPEERAKKMTEKMAAELELSEEQRAEILALNLDQAKKRQAEMDQKAAEMQARKAEMDAHQSKVNFILTEEQRTKWEEIKLEQRKQRRPGGQIHDRGDFPRRRSGN